MYLGRYLTRNGSVDAPVDGGPANQTESPVDEEGPYSEIWDMHTGIAGLDDSDNIYIDLDGVTANGYAGAQSPTDPGCGDPNARSQGYERLDPSVLPILRRQPRRRRDYEELCAGGSAPTTPEAIEMCDRDLLNMVSVDRFHVHSC